MATYQWEIQRRWFNGAWSHQAVAGHPEDPRGTDRSDLPPDAFARNVAEEHQPQGEWRIVVWDHVGVGRPPVNILCSDGRQTYPIRQVS